MDFLKEFWAIISVVKLIHVITVYTRFFIVASMSSSVSASMRCCSVAVSMSRWVSMGCSSMSTMRSSPWDMHRTVVLWMMNWASGHWWISIMSM